MYSSWITPKHCSNVWHNLFSAFILLWINGTLNKCRFTAAAVMPREVFSSTTALKIQVIVPAACARISTSSSRVITTVKICNKIGPAGTWIWTTPCGGIWMMLQCYWGYSILRVHDSQVIHFLFSWTNRSMSQNQTFPLRNSAHVWTWDTTLPGSNSSW